MIGVEKRDLCKTDFPLIGVFICGVPHSNIITCLCVSYSLAIALKLPLLLLCCTVVQQLLYDDDDLVK